MQKYYDKAELLANPALMFKNPNGPKPVRQKGRKPSLVHAFSPELARDLNEKTPDIAAALVHYTLFTWQNSNYDRGNPKAFRSHRQLEEEMPYLRKSTIQDAINRLEKAGVLEVDRSQNPLSFYLPNRVLKKYGYKKVSRPGRIRVIRSWAVSHGILESILLGNLCWMVETFKECHATDEHGNEYYELKPSFLVDYLPRTADSISKALRNLKGVLIEHPTEKWHYRHANSSSDETYGMLKEAYSNASQPYTHTDVTSTCETLKALQPASMLAQKA